MNYAILLFTCILFVLSCKQESSRKDIELHKSSQAEHDTVDVKNDILSDLGSLYQFYHSRPITQKQIDENKIIDYVAERGLEVERSPSGLFYSVTRTGTGSYLNSQDKIKAHYKGMLLDGTVFDSSHKHGKPIEFQIGQMVGGWNEAMTYMKKGDSAILILPSHQAYGLRGFGDLIGPHETLIFEVEVLKE